MSDDSTTPKEEQQVFVSEYQKKLMSAWADTHQVIETDSEGKETLTSLPAPMIVEGNQARWINRKERRMHSARFRRAPDNRPLYDVTQAVQGLLKSMTDNIDVQNKVVYGKLDKYLPKPQQEKAIQLVDNKVEVETKPPTE